MKVDRLHRMLARERDLLAKHEPTDEERAELAALKAQLSTIDGPQTAAVRAMLRRP